MGIWALEPHGRWSCIYLSIAPAAGIGRQFSRPRAALREYNERLLLCYAMGTDASFGVASNIMCMPFLGRRVTRGWSTTGKPGTRRGVKR